MSIKRIADDTFIEWHERRVMRAVNNLEENGYEVYKIDNVKRPFLGFDVMFSGNITDIYYRKTNGNI